MPSTLQLSEYLSSHLCEFIQRRPGNPWQATAPSLLLSCLQAVSLSSCLTLKPSVFSLSISLSRSLSISLTQFSFCSLPSAQQLNLCSSHYICLLVTHPTSLTNLFTHSHLHSFYTFPFIVFSWWYPYTQTQTHKRARPHAHTYIHTHRLMMGCVLSAHINYKAKPMKAKYTVYQNEMLSHI